MGKKKQSNGGKKFLEICAMVMLVSALGGTAIHLIKVEEGLKIAPTVLTPSETLNDTLKNAEGDCELTISTDMKLTVLENGTILGPDGMKIVTIDGQNQGSITAIGAKQSIISPAEGATLYFKNLTINDETVDQGKAYRDYLWLSGDLVFENCTFTDSIYLKPGTTASFSDCTFISSTGRYYSVWVSDGTVNLEGCHFRGFRGLKIHEFDETEDVEKVTVKDCLFDTISEKPGIAIGDVDEDTSIVVKGNTFDGCIGWDTVGSAVGKDGLYECDTPLSEFSFVEKNNEVKNVRYLIEYKAIINSAVAVPEEMFIANGSYPTIFKSGESVAVSKLRNIDYDTYTDYTFVGWYLDQACKTPFEGTSNLKKNITLYAKISVGSWTANY